MSASDPAADAQASDGSSQPAASATPSSTARKPVDVAVGVLVQPDGRFLLTSRPQGKPYAGYWEFPGGKLEAGEGVEQALRRELIEELGIEIAQAHPWQQTVFDYPHALVRLHFCKVFQWSGQLTMREGQQMAWQALPVSVSPVLPGTVPVLRWLAEERGFVCECVPAVEHVDSASDEPTPRT